MKTPTFAFARRSAFVFAFLVGVVGGRGLDKDAPRSIKGGKNEDGSVAEGYVTFYIFFRAAVPGTRESVGLLINIEAQRKSKPDYDLLKRASYYAARLVSSQKRQSSAASHITTSKKFTASGFAIRRRTTKPR